MRTKFRSAKRMEVFPHERCICGDEGATVEGQAEHEEQSIKHGGNKDMLVLARNVSTVFRLMRLERHGVYRMVVDDDGRTQVNTYPTR